MKKLILLWAATAVLLPIMVLAGCETMKGAGKDLQKAGTWVERKADQ